MGGSYNKNGRRKDPQNGSKRKLPYHETSGKTKNQMGDVVQRDAIQLLEIRGWRRRAEDKDE
jgi:hypothetical protein